MCAHKTTSWDATDWASKRCEWLFGDSFIPSENGSHSRTHDPGDQIPESAIESAVEQDAALPKMPYTFSQSSAVDLALRSPSIHIVLDLVGHHARETTPLTLVPDISPPWNIRRNNFQRETANVHCVYSHALFSQLYYILQ